MASFLQKFGSWFGFGASLGESKGQQIGTPTSRLVEGTRSIGVDGALQISTFWACVELRANTVASLPFFAYKESDGKRKLARTSRLYSLLHESPNSRMTPLEFWRAMMMSHDVKGNAYARLERDESGEVFAMWPMSPDQTKLVVLDDGSVVYEYTVSGQTVVMQEDSVLHLKGLGNGTVGLERLSYMAATTDELASAQTAATKLYAASGKPTGVLMIDAPLSPQQRESLRNNYGELASTSTQRLAVLEANMKYEQISLSPQEMQLLETRNYGVVETCRWMATPPVLVQHNDGVTYNGSEQVIDSWHKLVIRPILVGIEQAVRKRVMTPRQRASMTVEFSHDALLRGNLKDRLEIYAQAVQNGIYVRNECRQFENLPPIDGADDLTVQSNLVPIKMLGAVQKQQSMTPVDKPVQQ